ncbi:MAG: hypothetical protein ACE10D_12835, partial [Planctomycetota bacterium]
LNDERLLEPKRLRKGDCIRIGPNTLIFDTTLARLELVDHPFSEEAEITSLPVERITTSGTAEILDLPGGSPPTLTGPAPNTGLPATGPTLAGPPSAEISSALSIILD